MKSCWRPEPTSIFQGREVSKAGRFLAGAYQTRRSSATIRQQVLLLLVVEITVPRVVKGRVRIRIFPRSLDLQRALYLGTSNVID
jgi:hypothetical protein